MSQIQSGSLSTKNLAILSDEFGVDNVSMFSATNCSKLGTIPAGTRVTVLGSAGLTGYVLVMTARGDVFEVWHENLSAVRGSNSKLN